MNKYIYLLAVVFGLSGCNDFLELSPTNKVIETDYYQTQEDLTEALVAAYDPLKWNAYNAYSSYELVSNIMSDDAETGGSTVSDQPQLQRVNDFTNWVTPTNLPEGMGAFVRRCEPCEYCDREMPSFSGGDDAGGTS